MLKIRLYLFSLILAICLALFSEKYVLFFDPIIIYLFNRDILLSNQMIIILIALMTLTLIMVIGVLDKTFSPLVNYFNLKKRKEIAAKE